MGSTGSQEHWIAALLAAGLVGALGLLLRSRLKLAWFLVVPLGLVAVLELDDAWRNVSYHGLMHASLVYELLERGAPPENPLLAGHSLRYPYAHHWLIAQAMRIVPAAPPLFFAATNLVCLGLFLWLVDRIARGFDRDRVFRAYAGLLALTGTSPFSIGVARDWLRSVAFAPDRRTVPFTKFTTVNSNQVGLVFFALAMLGLLGLLRRDARRGRALACLAAGVGGAGLLYPYVGFSAGLCAGVVAVGAALRGAVPRSASAGILAATAAGTLIAAPFLLSILASAGSGEGEDLASTFSLATGIALRRNAFDLGLVLALPALLVALRRDALAALWRAHATPLAALVLAAAVNALLYLALHVTSWRAQYKFAALAMILVAVPLASVLAAIHRRRAWAAHALTLLLLAPVAHWCASLAPGRWAVEHEVVARGRHLEPLDAAERELHAWLGARTPPDAVVIDTTLLVPALARRPLLVAPGARPRDASGKDGWGNGPEMLYDAVPELVRRRRALARGLLGRAPAARTSAALRALVAEAGGRPLYVVARAEAVRSWLDTEPPAKPVFANGRAGIFAIEPE